MSNEEDPIAMVMVSGVFQGWPEYQAILHEMIEAQGLAWTSIDQSVRMPDHERLARSLDLVSGCDAYIGLVELQYGHIPEDPEFNPYEHSLSQLEFDKALELNKHALLFFAGYHSPIYLDSDADRLAKIEAFRARAKNAIEDSSDGRRFWVPFDSLEDFKAKASVAVIQLRSRLAEYLEFMSRNLDGSLPSSTKDAYDARSAQQSSTPAVQPGPDAVKPLVFISASQQDAEWTNRLRRALDGRQSEIDWWDHSKRQNSNPEVEIEAMIGSAAIGVVLLSPDYLASEYAGAELSSLRRKVDAGALWIFPIVLDECVWQSVPALNGINVWRNGEPVGGMSDAATDDELAVIVDSIVREAKEVRKSEDAVIAPPLAADLVFSESAQAILDRARELAQTSRRTEVSSSCLLFAFAEVGGEETNTSSFVRSCFLRTGAYNKALDTFLSDGVSGNPESVEASGTSVSGTSERVAAVLQNAAEIAVRISLSREIFPRHLLAGLLITPDTSGSASARIKEMGIDVEHFRHDFLWFLNLNRPNDNQTAWAEVLTPKGFQAGTAGYNSEFCGVGRSPSVEDHLGVDRWACQLAELIALRETKLPLAIGLFGNWGSGKSHFMNLIDRRLKSLMEEEKEGAKTRHPDAQGRWCSEIVPIYFNAWHYLDTNLWASLVAQIFESLFAHLRPKIDLEKMEQLLAQAAGATARAAEEVEIAHQATQKAQRDLTAAEADRRKNQGVIDGLLQGLKALLPTTTEEELQEQVVQLLDGKKQVKTLRELKTLSKEAHLLRGRLRSLWTNIWKPPGVGWRLGWLIASVALVPALLATAAVLLPFVKDWLQGIGRPIGVVLTLVSPFLLWFLPLLEKTKEPLHKVEAWVRQAQAAQKVAQETAEVIEAEKNLKAATALEDTSKVRLAEAHEREKQLKEEAKNLAPERRLGRFIEQRAQSADYRGQLGLVSLARKDFQELSDIFANDAALKTKVDKLQDSKGKSKREAREDRVAAEEIQELSRSIDRIVLFVDDLDRCQPEKVVEILQAVHLLLAFPLFAVVVGVDQRCLRQSLRMQFKGLLTPEGESGRAKHGPFNKSLAEDDERPATPLDYLEKIFHVPFHLPVMGEKGFEQLIDWLSSPPATTTTAASNGSAPQRGPTGDRESTGPPALWPEPREQRYTFGSSSRAEPDELNPVPSDPVAVVVEDEPAPDPKAFAIVDTSLPATQVAVTTGLIGSVPLRSWEREALRDYHPLILTPRAATRLLNTYRLVRASVPSNEWPAFSGGAISDGEFRVAMLLLAAAAGYPALAREWFERMCTTTPDRLFQQEEGLEAESPWLNFQNVYKATFANVKIEVTQELLAKWVDRVERFAF